MKIFWRIFLAFLLVSVSVMTITAVVVIQRMEGSRAIEQHQENMVIIAQSIIELHESGRPIPHRMRDFRGREGFNGASDQPPPHPGDSSPRNFRNFPFGLKIETEDGETLFRHRFFRENNPDNLLSVTVTSDSGKRYVVQSVRPTLPRFFKTLITRTYSIQFIFILIGSIIASALLSWSLTRPLKKLGLYSRSFALGDESAVIDPTVLSRRDELGDLANDLEYMSTKIRATLDSQQQLLHDVSHELRAPLARLQASVALVEKQCSETRHIDRMHKECERINALIQQILDFSRLNRDSETKKPCDLSELVDELLETLRFEFGERQFDFQTPEIPITKTVYRNALQGAVDNIVRNACRYAPPDTPIDIHIEHSPTRTAIIVRDHGPGVDNSELEKLLQPFYRSGQQMHTDGFGLGLSIAQKALVKHNGTLTLRNHPQGGLEVVMVIGELKA